MRGKRYEWRLMQVLYNQGMYYQNGIKEIHGLPPDYAKALELFHRAGELGYAKAYNNLGYAYENGEGVEELIRKRLDITMN